jgi:hypothetical protein
MATSGSKSVTVTSWDTLKFNWSITSQSVTDNTSTISWNMQLISGSSGKIDSTAAKPWVVGITGPDDQGYNYEGTNSIAIANNTTKTLASGSTTVKHKPDGTCSVSFTFGQTFDITFSGVYIYTKADSFAETLPTIYSEPSTMDFFMPDGIILGKDLTPMIKKANSSFRHKIRYNCGSVSGYLLGSSSATSTAANVTWTPPLSLANQAPDSTTVPIKFTLDTFTSEGTSVGSWSKVINYTIPDSIKPTASMKLTDVTEVDKTYGSPVQGLSRIKIEVTGTPSYGSPIASYTITANGEKHNVAEATTGFLKNSGDSVVTVTVKDKRGRTGSASYTMKVQAYHQPNVSALTVHRCDADGVEDEQGEYIQIIFSAAVSSLSDRNTASYKLEYKKSLDDEYTVVELGDLANVYTVTNRESIIPATSDSSYDIAVTATDKHSSMTRTTSASTGFTLLNCHPSGKGIAFGKVAERSSAFEVALDSYFDGATIQAGTAIRTGNKYCMSTPGVANIAGYILMARIRVTAANADTPMTFVFTRRGAPAPMTVHVSLTNPTADASAVSQVVYEGANYGAFLVGTDGLTWDLYVQKGSEWDTITLQDWWTSKTMESRVAVTFPGTLVDTLPSPFWRATPAKLESLLDYIYPVGSVYISYSHVSPGDMFGGTWVRITNAFLWAVDASGEIGLTGGTKTHTLTVNELPSHSHGSVYSQHATGTKDKAWYTTSGTSVAYGTVATGGGQAHNNMPPYIQVSVWRRTA